MPTCPEDKALPASTGSIAKSFRKWRWQPRLGRVPIATGCQPRYLIPDFFQSLRRAVGSAHDLLRGGSLHHFLLVIDFVFVKIPEILDVAELIDETNLFMAELNAYESSPANTRDWTVAYGMKMRMILRPNGMGYNMWIQTQVCHLRHQNQPQPCPCRIHPWSRGESWDCMHDKFTIQT